MLYVLRERRRLTNKGCKIPFQRWVTFYTVSKVRGLLQVSTSLVVMGAYATTRVEKSCSDPEKGCADTLGADTPQNNLLTNDSVFEKSNGKSEILHKVTLSAQFFDSQESSSNQRVDNG